MRDAGAYVDDVPEPDLDDVEASYLDEGGEFLVGEVDGRIVAMGAFRPATGYLAEFLEDPPAATAELKRMRVDPDHQRRGYGRRVYEGLERRARDRGFTDLALDVTPDQTGARRLYEAMGFEAVRRESVRPNDERFELLFYRKRLGTAGDPDR